MNTTLEYSTRVVQEGDRRCKKSTLNDLAYLTPLRIPLMNPAIVSLRSHTCNSGTDEMAETAANNYPEHIVQAHQNNGGQL